MHSILQLIDPKEIGFPFSLIEFYYYHFVGHCCAFYRLTKACLYSRYAETSIQDGKLFKTLVMRYTLRFKN